MTTRARTIWVRYAVVGAVLVAVSLFVALGGIDFVTDGVNDTNILMANHDRNRNCLLCPVVPVIDMNVGPAYRSVLNSYQDILRSWRRLVDFAQP